MLMTPHLALGHGRRPIQNTQNPGARGPQHKRLLKGPTPLPWDWIHRFLWAPPRRPVESLPAREIPKQKRKG